jgi:hypothetical protein
MAGYWRAMGGITTHDIQLGRTTFLPVPRHLLGSARYCLLAGSQPGRGSSEGGQPSVAAAPAGAGALPGMDVFAPRHASTQMLLGAADPCDLPTSPLTATLGLNGQQQQQQQQPASLPASFPASSPSQGPPHAFGGLLGSGPGGVYGPVGAAGMAGGAGAAGGGGLPSMPPLPPGMQPRQRAEVPTDELLLGPELPQQLVASGSAYKVGLPGWGCWA